MNKILLTAFSGLMLSNVQAQQINETILVRQHQEALQKALMEQHRRTGYVLKPTGLQQRVIAQCVKRLGSLLPSQTDSVIYGYTGSRGSRFDFNSLDVGYTGPENTLAPGPFSLLAESWINYSNGNSYQTGAITYRPDDKVNAMVIRNANPPSDISRTINSYDNEGRAVATYYTEYPGTGDTNRMTRYRYNNADQRTADSSWIKENGSWHLTDFQEYHYNTIGQKDTATFWTCDQNTPKLDNKSVYTYYPDGTLCTMSWYKHVSDTALYSVYDTLGYTPGIRYFTFAESLTLYQDGSRLLTNQRIRRENFPAVNGSLDSAKFYIRNGDSANWDLNKILRYSCNDFGNPDSIREFRYVQQQEFHTRAFTFYYETYEEVLGIASPEKNCNFDLYPNPFTTKLFIRCSNKAAGGAYRFRLINMLGATMWSESKSWNTDLHSFNMPATLTPGIYLFQIVRNDAPVYTARLVKK